jgi:hypothetical protein
MVQSAVSYPIPAGRGRWRITLHNRQWDSSPQWSTTMIAELSSARSRRLDQAWNSPAQLTFTLDGKAPEAALIRELQTDVMAWRWDDQPGAVPWGTMGTDRPLFRGVITQSEDEVSENTHTVIFTAHDYLAMLGRRYNPQPLTWTQVDQDTLVFNFVQMAIAPLAASGANFAPGGYLPIGTMSMNPDATRRLAASGQLRDRTYTAATPLDQMLDDLAKVIGGFDYDIIPGFLSVILGVGTAGQDMLRVFYPYQGVQRFDVPLVYGSTVSAFTRSVDSGDYANYWRVIGNAPAGSADGTPPMFSEQWNTDSNNVTVVPIGLWQNVENAADVTIQSTLDQQALGDLAISGVLTHNQLPASYTLTLRPGAYLYGSPNMGDICPVVIQTGRLNVNDNIRVLGISYDIGDDGEEDVSLTVGRPTRTLTQLLTQADRDADALTRR